MTKLTALLTTALFFGSQSQAQSADTIRVHAETREWVSKLRDPNTRAKAQKEILRIGKWGVAVVAESLEASVKAGERAMVRTLLETISRLGPQARETIPLLGDLANQVAPEEFIQLMETVGNLAPYYQDKAATVLWRLSPALQEQLKKLPPRRWAEAIQATDRCAARLAINFKLRPISLIERLTSDNSYQREAAADLLAYYDEMSSSGIQSLRDAIESSHPRIRIAEKVTLDGDQGKPTVVWGKASYDVEVRTAAARALVEISDQPTVEYTALIMLLHRGRADERAFALRSLSTQVLDLSAYVPNLVAVLEDKAATGIREAIDLLGLLGPKASSALPALEDATRRPDKELADRAAAALHKIRGH